MYVDIVVGTCPPVATSSATAPAIDGNSAVSPEWLATRDLHADGVSVHGGVGQRAAR